VKVDDKVPKIPESTKPENLSSGETPVPSKII